MVKVKVRDAAFEFLTQFPLTLCEFEDFSWAHTAEAVPQKCKYITYKNVPTAYWFFGQNGAQSSETQAGVQEEQIPGNSNWATPFLPLSVCSSAIAS